MKPDSPTTKYSDDVRQSLRPRRQIEASDKLRSRIDAELDSAFSSSLRRSGLWLASAIAVAVMLAILILPVHLQATTPTDLLQSTLDSLRGMDSFEIDLMVRTSTNDNFRMLDPEADPVATHISVERTDSGLLWRVDKGGRKATKRPEGTYVWIDTKRTGWYSMEKATATLGYLSVFLYPDKVLESELNLCMSHSEAESSVACRGSNYILTIRTQPEGDFSNPYMLNTSVENAESIRRYTIDSRTRRLRAASVSVVNDGIETEVIRLTDIRYGTHTPGIAEIPADIDFIDADAQSYPEGIGGLGERELASAVLNAFSGWKEEVLSKVLERNLLAAIRDKYSGSEILLVGEPFKSGADTTLVFVPYRLRLRNGYTKEMNLSIQRNKAGRWIVAGGF